ncbi:hypothetical protein TIFTF001_019533 [Ficus carica]|uniref:Uncharacterized protein n=1 Tax=Ficus carica TaxID=3494 RepID=A0AA88ADL7_FICCA|nr:hypothetical protein TIFTF001_019533 [Ficus carica]
MEVRKNEVGGRGVGVDGDGEREREEGEVRPRYGVRVAKGGVAGRSSSG